ARRRNHRRTPARGQAARGGPGDRPHLRVRHAPGGPQADRSRVSVHRHVAEGRARWSRVPRAVRWEAIIDMDVRSYIAQNAGSFFDDLKEWLRIPSISADPARHPDVRASADWLAAYLRATGFPEVEIWETGTPESPGLPSVFAYWPAADPAALAVCVY